MIIAIYEGCGLTEYGRSTWDGIDMSALPYRYVMPEKNAEMESGSEMADPEVTECELDMDWPANYIRAVVMAYHRYRYVAIPMIRAVLEDLRCLRIPYVLCYPARALLEDNAVWLAEDEYGRHIVLEPGKGPADHREEIVRYTDMMETTIQVDLEEDLISLIQKNYEKGGMCIEEQIRQCLIHLVEYPEVMEEWGKG